MIPWEPSALVNHLWQSTLVVAGIWLAALALRHNAARVRCWLWTAASIKFLLPLSMLVSLGEQFQWRTAPAAVQPAVLFVMEDVLAPADVIAVVPASVPPSAPVWPWLLLAVWCTGAVVVLISWWRQWLPIRAALRRATPVTARCEVRRGRSRGAVLPFDAGTSRGRHPPPAIGAARGHPRAADARAVARAHRARALPHPLPRQSHRRDPHGGRSDLLVPPGGVVDRVAPDRRARARVRRGGAAVGKSAGRLRRRHSRGLPAVGRITAGVRGRRERIEPARAGRGDHAERDRPAADARPAIGTRRCGGCGRGRTGGRRFARHSIAGGRPSRRARIRNRLDQTRRPAPWPESARARDGSRLSERRDVP